MDVGFDNTCTFKASEMSPGGYSKTMDGYIKSYDSPH